MREGREGKTRNSGCASWVILVELLVISRLYCTRCQWRTRRKADGGRCDCGDEGVCDAAPVPFPNAAPDTGSRVIGRQVTNWCRRPVVDDRERQTRDGDAENLERECIGCSPVMSGGRKGGFRRGRGWSSKVEFQRAR